MTATQTSEAIVYTDASGRYVDANQAACELLGVSLNDLLASPPDRFAFDPAAISEEQAALAAQWDGTTPLVGHGGLRRADGSPIRVSFAFEPVESGFILRMSRLEDPPEAPPVLLSVGDVLREWRAAERALAALEPGTDEWARVEAEIAALRARYQSLFASVRPST